MHFQHRREAETDTAETPFFCAYVIVDDLVSGTSGDFLIPLALIKALLGSFREYFFLGLFSKSKTMRILFKTCLFRSCPFGFSDIQVWVRFMVFSHP